MTTLVLILIPIAVAVFVAFVVVMCSMAISGRRNRQLEKREEQ